MDMNMAKQELDSSNDWSQLISASNQNPESGSGWTLWGISDKGGNSGNDDHSSSWDIDNTTDERAACSKTFVGSCRSGPSVHHPQQDTWGQSLGDGTNNWNGSDEDAGRGWNRNRSWNNSSDRDHNQDLSQSKTHGKGHSRSKSPTLSPRGDCNSDTYGWGGRRNCGSKMPPRPCRDFLSGSCRWGSRCKFLHDDGNRSNSMRSESGPSKHRRLENFDLHDWKKDRLSSARRKSTVICEDYAAGKCNWGSSCKFSHSGDSVDKERTEQNTIGSKSIVICKDHAAGKCKWGFSCKFFHPDDSMDEERTERNSYTDNYSRHDRYTYESGAKTELWGRLEGDSWGGNSETDKKSAEGSSCKQDIVLDDSRWSNVTAVKSPGGWVSWGNEKSNICGSSTTASEFVKDKWVETRNNSGKLHEGTVWGEESSGRDEYHSLKSVGGNDGFVPRPSPAISKPMEAQNTYAVDLMSPTPENTALPNEVNTIASDSFRSSVHSKQDDGSVLPQGAPVGSAHSQGASVVSVAEPEKQFSNGVQKCHGNEDRSIALKEQQQSHPHGVDSAVRVEASQSEKVFRFGLVEFVKETLKPTWKEGKMSREVHKLIVKKVVDKVTGSIDVNQAPKTREQVEHYISFCFPKLTKLIQDYVQKYLNA